MDFESLWEWMGLNGFKAALLFAGGTPQVKKKQGVVIVQT